MRGVVGEPRGARAQSTGAATRCASQTIARPPSSPGQPGVAVRSERAREQHRAAAVGEAGERGGQRVAARLARDGVIDRGEPCQQLQQLRERERDRHRQQPPADSGSEAAGAGSHAEHVRRSRARRRAARAGTAAVRRPRRGRRRGRCRRRGRSCCSSVSVAVPCRGPTGRDRSRTIVELAPGTPLPSQGAVAAAANRSRQAMERSSRELPAGAARAGHRARAGALRGPVRDAHARDEELGDAGDDGADRATRRDLACGRSAGHGTFPPELYAKLMAEVAAQTRRGRCSTARPRGWRRRPSASSR